MNTKEKIIESKEISCWILDDLIASHEVSHLVSYIKEGSLQKSGARYISQTLAIVQRNKNDRLILSDTLNNPKYLTLKFWRSLFTLNEILRNYDKRKII